MTNREKRTLKDGVKNLIGKYKALEHGIIEVLENNILSFINSFQEESVSEDLEEASKNYALNNTPWDDCKDEIQESFKSGAKWQKQKDQSTIELAEDHAMFAGMEKMKEEMIAKAIDAELYSDGMLTPIIKVNDKEKISDIKFGDEVKVIVIKKD